MQDKQKQAITALLAPRLATASTRKEKTRAVASALFFEFDIYPAAKIVREYTGQGSMTDIGADLREFWDELRNKGRAQIDAPYLPAELQEEFSGALVRLWQLATDKADAALEVERQECMERVNQAEQAVANAQVFIDRYQDEAKELMAELATERDRRGAAERQGAALEAQIDGLQEAVAKAEGQLVAQEQARKLAQEQFSRDLEAERAARKRDAETLNGEIRFAKMQIEAARASEQEARTRFKSDLAGKDVELETYRSRLIRAEEAAAALRQEVASAKIQAAALQVKLSDRAEEAKLAITKKPIRRSAPVKKFKTLRGNSP